MMGICGLLLRLSDCGGGDTAVELVAVRKSSASTSSSVFPFEITSMVSSESEPVRSIVILLSSAVSMVDDVSGLLNNMK